MLWYKEKIENIFKILESSEEGLTSSQARARVKKYGLNQLDLKKNSIWKVIIEPFKSIFILVLVLAAVISFASKESLDAIIISSIILVNAVIYYTQHYTTSRVLRSLKKHSIQKVTVYRDGTASDISSVYLVPGDIILVNEGERVPADARVVSASDLQVDESSLTGESNPVYKHASAQVNNKQIYEQSNIVFQGTYVLSGTAKVIVVETGGNTEFGKIAKISSDKDFRSPVQVKIDHLISVIIKGIAVVAIIAFTLSLIRGIPTDEALKFVMSLTVSAVPEGLPVALTVIIVLGMRRMAKHKALVRSFGAIENIGLVTTIATDKTGTLTKNHLSVVDSWSISNLDVIKIALNTLNIKEKNTDPLDLAILELNKDKKINEINHLYPFDLSSRMSGAYIEKDKTIYIKGSPEHILYLSNLTNLQVKKAESKMHEFASQGYRVIAIARFLPGKSLPKKLTNLPKGKLEFVGYLAFADELRPEASRAVHAAQKAGVNVKLITGDHFETAYNIGQKIGLASHPSQVIQGTNLSSDDKEFTNQIENKTVFARILPEDKYRILKALKKTEITAMTGDGVNDVPALSNAHIGIAMGSGSDIAKDAGGIILLNDNFATIVKAIAEGRKIFDNIRRMLFYLIATSFGEVLTMVGALIVGLPLPLTAIQILWVNLVTDTALVIPLGLEPEEDNHMKRPPRKPSDPLLGKLLLSRMFIVSFTMATVTLIVFFHLKNQGFDTAYAQTVAFMILIVAQWTNAFNARSEYQSSFKRLNKKNPAILVGLAIAVFLQALVMFGPLKPVFNIQPVPVSTLATYSLIMAISILSVVEIHKIISRRFFNHK